MTIEITESDTPPPADDSAPVPPSSNGWFNDDFPHSTEEHPYGFFDGPDGQPDFSRPRKRKPRGYGGTAVASGPRGSSKPAGNPKQAAALLARMNLLAGMGLIALGLPQTAQQLRQANEGFEEMAYDALVNDPALCRKILSAGASSGKSQLFMAYAMLGVAVAPVAVGEFREARANEIDEVS